MNRARKHRGAMRIDDTLRRPRRARRCSRWSKRSTRRASASGGPVLRRQQALIGEEMRQRSRRRCRLRAHVDPAAHCRQPRGDALGNRKGRRVDADPAVLGVIDDEDERVVVEPRVDRVQHGTHAGDAIEQLEMMVRVPGQRADAVAIADAERQQGLGQPFAAVARGRIGIAVEVALNRACHDLGAAMHRGSMLDNARDEQRRVHHQTAHGPLP